MNQRYSIWREGDEHKEKGGCMEMERTPSLQSFLEAILKLFFSIKCSYKPHLLVNSDRPKVKILKESDCKYLILRLVRRPLQLKCWA